MIPDFFTPRPEWELQLAQIEELLERVRATEQLSGRVPKLRRADRIGSVHSSTAIEGNQLTLGEVEAIADHEPVLGPPREIQEVQNALDAYEQLNTLNPWSSTDLLRAHSLLTKGLIAESGTFRTVDVEIVNAAGTVLHTGSRHAKVPRLVTELLEWGAGSPQHPLIVSSATHFLLEYIHPFRDGNGRIGRLWQTLILSKWQPLFAWMPTETLIHAHQRGYYDALQASHHPEIDAAPFIDYMLDIITATLNAHETRLLDETRVLNDNKQPDPSNTNQTKQ